MRARAAQTKTASKPKVAAARAPESSGNAAKDKIVRALRKKK